ncbi:hypothetical protein BZG02_02640 [Labilibaculum filiforme]|uniref:Uncharacterized protein n=1 Tax=Labilibaculum filiforme TaxID=1940526 RepID=A0A2N3I6J4_9BACT|nr:hypothetical protein [Labilibaculum filiforme]PKQ65919.1 hypothetical protein BZG02_02640 [Labilibaculum filiforme]
MTQSRSYYGSDANFINFASQRIKLIEEKHADFIGFSPIFTSEGFAELKTIYDEACNITSDNAYIDIQAKATENVKLDLDACCKFYQRCKFDIQMAFPNDKKMWDQFGFNDYEEARKSGKYMYMFLTDLHMVSTRNTAALQKIGWTEESFSQILTLRDKLKADMILQSDCIMDRSRATENRTNKLNSLYEKMAVYFKAARILYDSNEETLKWFKFPAQSSSKNESETEEEVLEQL